MSPTLTALLALVLALGAPPTARESGGHGGAARPAPPLAAAHDAHAPLRTPPHGVPPLLDASGAVRPPLPEAVPRERPLRTRAGLYATREQAEDLDGDLRGDVIWVELACDGPAAIEQALDKVQTARDAHALGADAPVLLSAEAPGCRHVAAWLADRLDDLGHSRVFLLAA
jgi:hypothetical protein